MALGNLGYIKDQWSWKSELPDDFS
jgi:hypothetical protein